MQSRNSSRLFHIRVSRRIVSSPLSSRVIDRMGAARELARARCIRERWILSVLKIGAFSHIEVNVS